MNKLNIIDTYFESLNNLIAFKSSIARSLIIPAFVVIGIDLLGHYYSSSLSLFIMDILKLFIYSVMAIMIHRILLDSSTKVGFIRFLKIRNSEIVYFLYLLIFYTLTTLLIIFIASFIIPLAVEINLVVNKLTELILSFLIVFLPLLLLSKLSLIFPAIAISSRHDLYQIFRISKSNSVRLFVIVGSVPLFYSFVLSNIQTLNGSIYGKVFVSILSVVFLIIETSLLSISFKFLNQEDVH